MVRYSESGVTSAEIKSNYRPGIGVPPMSSEPVCFYETEVRQRVKKLLDSSNNNNYTAVVMDGNRLLGGFENLLLLAIVRLGDRAYGVSIRQELLDRAEKDVAIGAIYTALDRLEQKGLVKSWTGEPTPERGGRAKKFYRVTAQGKTALQEMHRAIDRLSFGIEWSFTTCLSL